MGKNVCCSKEICYTFYYRSVLVFLSLIIRRDIDNPIEKLMAF